MIHVFWYFHIKIPPGVRGWEWLYDYAQLPPHYPLTNIIWVPHICLISCLIDSCHFHLCFHRCLLSLELQLFFSSYFPLLYIWRDRNFLSNFSYTLWASHVKHSLVTFLIEQCLRSLLNSYNLCCGWDEVQLPGYATYVLIKNLCLEEPQTCLNALLALSSNS